MKKIIRYITISLTLIIFLVLFSFVAWAEFPASPQPAALESLRTTNAVEFSDESGWLVFTPNGGQTPSTGLILYPGARVDPRAYAPTAQQIAAEGFQVVIVPMSLNFAFLSPNKASQVMDTFPEINTWAVGGHSLGGAMAAQYAGNHLDRVDGLVLWAAYPGKSNDLSESDLDVLSISAGNDGLATPQEIETTLWLLPPDAVTLEILGGNHAGFGYYGPQNGDGRATISLADQQAQIVTATASFLKSLTSTGVAW
ncbi:alpha/beta hydrolase [bacterium]|nr:alpha/beta hydrolase [bacterium]